MPRAKQNQLLQFLTPLVDRTDGLSIESGVTSNFTQRLWGVRHGTSAAATAKTPSKTPSVVRSGVFRVTLKSTEVSDFDEVFYQLTHASCADQNWLWTLYTSDDSDLTSQLTVIQSMASDAASAAQQANSRVLLNQSRISDIASYLVAMSSLDSDVYSMLSDFLSDFQSRVPKRVATDSQLSDVHSDLASKIGAITASVSASDISDIASAVWANTIGARVDSRVLLNLSRISDVYSLLSDTNSDLRSLLTTTGVELGASTMSDLRSAIGAGPAATITASDISDIASAVWANTIGARVDSRVLLNLSRISDVYSLLSDTNSDLRSLLTTTGVELGASTLSDLRSAIAAGPAATITASDISDIASAVQAILASTLSDTLSAAQQTNSRVLLNLSRISDVYSLLSDTNSDLRSLLTTTGVELGASTMSDLRSAIAGVTATLSASDISDIASAVQAILASTLSDTLSAAQQTNSRALVIQSHTSNIYSLLSDVQSDFTSLLTTTGVQLNASTMSDLRSAITGVAATITASDISDIASAVQAILASTLSDTLSAAQQANSRALVVQSQTSDIYSLLSDVASDITVSSGVQSDIYSLLTAVNTGVTDLSAVGSNIYSMLSDLMSDFQSRVPGRITHAASTLTELSADPGTNPTIAQAAMLLYMWLRNNGKTTSTKRFLRNNAGATVLSATMSDDGTSFLQGKLG